jgi:uncharacterized protein (TIGR02246 family)
MMAATAMAVGLLCVAAGAGSLAAQGAAATVSAADEAAIRALVQKYVDARDQGNAEAVAALFTADADQLVSSGEWRKGRDKLVSGAMASSQREGKRTITIETIRPISADVALADGRYQIASLTGGAPRQMWTAFVVSRKADGWRIAAIRNMLPAPPASATPPAAPVPPVPPAPPAPPDAAAPR